MKSYQFSVLAALAARQAMAHATFQQLWVNGEDLMSLPCARLPLTNSPVESVSGPEIRCNAGTSPAAAKCPVKAGDTVTVEMHQQPNDRSCEQEAIGGAHYGPALVYLSQVDDASTADGSAPWFKIYQNSWAKNPTGGSGDDDFWGTKDMNNCCGLIDVTIPDDVPAGDYLLRAEVIALHTAGGQGGAQFYMTCYQITVEGGGSASPETVEFPGAYAASDPGILVNIHAPLDSYVAPGPEVYVGGTTVEAGSGCTGCAQSCTPGAWPAATLAPSA